MAEDFEKNIKLAKIYADTLDSINQKIDTQNKRVGFLAQEMGIAYGGFIKQIEKSNEQRREELKLLNKANAAQKEQQKNAGAIAIEALGLNKILDKSASTQDIINKHLTSQFKDIKDIHGINDKLSELQQEMKEGNDDAKKHYEELKKIKDNIHKDQEKNDKIAAEALGDAIDNNELLQATLKAMGVDLSNNREIIRTLNSAMEDGTHITSAMASLTRDDLGKSYEENVDKIERANQQSNMLVTTERERSKIAQVQANALRDQVGLWEKLEGFVENNAATIKKDLWSAMKDYDQAISDAGRDFGYIQDMSVGTAVQMANLNSEAARFGMNVGQVQQMMGKLGEELSTIDQKYLANSVGHFVAIEKATGISSEEITTIAGEMMRAGKSASEVEQYMEGSNKVAKMFGVNTKKVLQGVSRNIDKMRQMGFTGGEQSLTRMVATAERLRMNVDEIFDVAAKARNIEGAMNMAADLQLAGGSFANIDPMSLLSAARKGPEELQKILTQMGDDIGSFNEDGEFKFDPVDVDRLQIVADATGQSIDSIQKMIQKNAETNKKTDMLGLSSAISEEDRNFIADLTSIDKDTGLLKMDDDLMKYAEGAGISLDGVDDLGSLNQEQIQALMKAKEDDLASLEEQAEQNQSFSESMTALKDAFMNIFTVFEPLIKWLTELVQWLNGSTAGKWVVGMGALAFIAIPKLVGAFGKFKEGVSSLTSSFKGMKEGKGFLGKLKGAFTGATPESGGIKDESGKLKGIESKDGTPGKSGGGLKSLSKGLSAMGGKNVRKGIANTALAGPALLLMLPAMPTLLLMAGIGAMGKFVELGFRSVARGISAMGNAKGLLKGALAMVLIGGAMIPFAFALSLMAGVEWSAIGMMVVGIIALAGITALLGFIAPMMLAGALALAAASVGLLVFGAAVLVFAQGAAAMQGMEFGWLGDLGWNLLVAAPGLLLGGLALLAAVPGLVLGSVGLMQFATVAQLISTTDWNAFSAMGPALASVVPGLLAFSLAGLMFANPITMLGMVMMMGTLAGLAAVMTPLAQSLIMGADGLERFSSGLEKLQEAANNLDFERLEALKDLSMGMAVAGAGTGALGDAIDKIAEAISKLSGGGSGGGGGTQKIEVNLKLNGRDLQSIIIDDTEIVT